MASFNLIDEPWIPCIDMDGVPRLLSIRETLLDAHNLRAISAESPLVEVALSRLLLAILHSAYRGPKERSDWIKEWTREQWDETVVGPYLDRWHHRFDLFAADRPFYQISDARVKPKSIAALVHEFSSGNNATLFNHSLDDDPPVLDPAQAAQALITAMAFGLSGLSGLPDKFTSAPCAGGIIFLAQGRSLFSTLALNWVLYDDSSPIPQLDEDKPAWEADDPFQPARTVPHGYLDYLTWQNRRLLLLSEGDSGETRVRMITMAPGMRLEDQNDPMKHYSPHRERGLVALRFNESRALWRDSSAILYAAGKKGEAPAPISWLSELVGARVLDSKLRLQFAGAGMASDQAKVLFYRSERLPLPLVYLSETGGPLLERLQQAIQYAEKTSDQLWGSSRTLAWNLLATAGEGGEGKEPRRADLDQMMKPWQLEQRFWSRLDARFQLLMDAIPQRGEEPLEEWCKYLRATAITVFEDVSSALGMQPRALHAWTQADAQLRAGLAKVLPNSEKQAANESNHATTQSEARI